MVARPLLDARVDDDVRVLAEVDVAAVIALLADHLKRHQLSLKLELVESRDEKYEISRSQLNSFQRAQSTVAQRCCAVGSALN